MNFTYQESRQLKSLGRHLYEERKKRKVSAQALAESIQVSRLTLYRLEKGEPTVAIGVFIKVMGALGLICHMTSASKPNLPEDSSLLIPARIPLADYPELRNLAWHAQGIAFLKPLEAFEIYDRNRRHLDSANLSDNEKKLIEALNLAFEGRLENV